MSTFSTERLPLAIAIHASGRLSFRSCDRIGTEKVEFLFDDPDSVGSQVELEFDSGALAVPAIQIFASQKFLRRQMSQALEENRSTSHGRAR